jgi:hypothetical protein
MTVRDDIFRLLDMLDESGHDMMIDPAIIAADIISEEFDEDDEIDPEEAINIQGYVIEWQARKEAEEA